MTSKPFRTNPIGEGLNIYRHGGWLGQLERVRRWHKRIDRLHNSEAIDSLDSFVLDYVYAFFQNCNQLADWISNDAPDRKAAVERLIRTTPELQICRDIANATKHLDLDRPPKVAGGFADGREYVPGDSNGAGFFVIAGGEKYQLFDLVNRCMEAWERFADESD
jgi:hypothetical protein